FWTVNLKKMQVRQMGIKHNSLYLHRKETEGAPELPMFSLAKDNDSSNEEMGLSTIPEVYSLKV
ncbi:hypothetical protein MR532_00050, partial [bacterium]|nr:hypothetical protein [bacterium]